MMGVLLPLTLFCLMGFSQSEKGDVALVPFTVNDNGQPSTQLVRIGSGPGWYDQDFILKLDTSSLSLEDDPGLRSQTAKEVSDAPTAVFQDVVYWKSTFSTQRFTIDSTQGNVLGLAGESDIFKEFAWLEVCPRHKMVVLHKTGTPEDIQRHVCGSGSKAIQSAKECTSVDQVGCIFKNLKLNFFDVSQEQHECTGLLAFKELDANTDKVYAPIRDRAPVLDGEINLYEKKWYATFDKSTVTLFPEHVPRHTHTWQTFLSLQLLLLFYTHFVSDKHKDIHSCWTRLPTFFGALVSVVVSFYVYSEIDLASRLYVMNDFFRHGQNINFSVGYTFSILYFGASLATAGGALVTLLAQYRFVSRTHTNSKALKFHLTVFYEMALSLPLISLLIGGGPRNLLNLLFLFTITLLVSGTRIRDFVRLIKNWKALKTDRGVTVQFASCVHLFTTTVFFIVIIPAVWYVVMTELFLLYASSVTATAMFSVLFFLFVFKYAMNHKVYYDLEADMKTNNNTCKLFNASKAEADKPFSMETTPTSGIRQRHSKELQFL